MKVIGNCIRVLCPNHSRRVEFISTMERRWNEIPHRTTGIKPSTLFLKRKFSPNGFPRPISEADFKKILEKARATTRKELARRKKYNEGDHLTIFNPGDIVYIRTWLTNEGCKKGYFSSLRFKRMLSSDDVREYYKFSLLFFFTIFHFPNDT